MADSEKAMLVEDDHEDMSSEEEEAGDAKTNAASLLKVLNLWHFSRIEVQHVIESRTSVRQIEYFIIKNWRSENCSG